MKFYDYYWPDSNIDGIKIEYDEVMLVIWNYAQRKRVNVRCTGLAGITDLILWDDTIIMNTEIIPVDESNSEFMKRLFDLYVKGLDYGCRSLEKQFYELKIELSNGNAFKVYCQCIEAFDASDSEDSFVR